MILLLILICVFLSLIYSFTLQKSRILSSNKRVHFVPKFKTSISNDRIFAKTDFSSDVSIVNKSSAQALFRFGVIADIQYADSEDALNFQGTKTRRYRHSLGVFEKAIKYWNNQYLDETEVVPIKFSIVLGDILDGKTSLLKQQNECYAKLMDSVYRALFNVYYCFGNHCHYSFSRLELHNNFLSKLSFNNSVGGACSNSKLYYDW